jgi:hypothetical protein
MTTYATSGDVQARVPYRDITATSKPSSDDVSGWINEAEAMLTAALRSSGISVPITAAEGLLLMRSWVLDYPIALVKMAYASAGGDGANEDGQAEMKRFEERIAAIESDPARHEAMLTGSSSSDSTRRIRGHVLDNADDKTIDNGDFAPEFEKGADWY